MPNDNVIQSNVFFGGVLDHVQKNEWHNWIPRDILHQKQVFVFFSKLNISKFGIFDMTLTWPCG